MRRRRLTRNGVNALLAQRNGVKHLGHHTTDDERRLTYARRDDPREHTA